MARKPQTTSANSAPSTPPTETNHPTGSQHSGAAPMTSFADILDTPLDQVEAPKPTPAGQYLAVIDGPHETGESSKQKTPYVRFKLKLLQGMEDVNPEDLAASKAIGRTVNADFYLTENSTFRLKQFLEDVLGIQAKTFKEALAQAPGMQVIAICRHELSTPSDGSEPRVQTRFDRFLKV